MFSLGQQSHAYRQGQQQPVICMLYYITPWPGFSKAIKTKNPEMLPLPKQRAAVQMERTFANVAETCAVFASSSSSSPFLQRKKYFVYVLSPSMQSQHPRHRSATPPDSQP